MLWSGRRTPFLIAEIGGNHEGDFAYARELTRLALDTGVPCVKFQIYTGDSLANPVEAPDRNKHFKRFELRPEQHLELARMCRDKGAIYCASVWDPEALPWIDPVLQFYKIGSGDLTCRPMLDLICQRRKPVVLSTGLATLDEVLDAVAYIQSKHAMYCKAENFAILQCTSMYPIKNDEANVAVMDVLRAETGLAVGYSDHTEGGLALRVAAARGAQVLEFHFTDRREGKTFRDHKVSLTPAEVVALLADLETIADLVGDGVKRPLPCEGEHVVSFRRGVFLRDDLPAGHRVERPDLVALRPNVGIDARDVDKIVGKTLVVSKRRHEKLSMDDFE